MGLFYRLGAAMKPAQPVIVTLSKRRLRAAAETGFVTVPGYRLYSLDGARKVASAEWIDADDDKGAVEAAKTMMKGQDCEVWQGTRLVARLNLRRKR